MDSIILVGGGGHCHSCIDVIEISGNLEIAGIIERDRISHSPIMEYPIIGSDSQLPELVERYKAALVTVGQIETSSIRERLYSKLLELGAVLPLVISPLSYVSNHAKLGIGTIVMHQATINANTSVGDNCIINTKALLEHDVEIGSHCHISTGAILNGGVTIGKGSFVGSGAIIREGIDIGPRSVIGAGVVVLKDIPADTVCIGKSIER